MMWLKKIEETKCPWCGNILSDECCEKDGVKFFL